MALVVPTKYTNLPRVTAGIAQLRYNSLKWDVWIGGGGGDKDAGTHFPGICDGGGVR